MWSCGYDDHAVPPIRGQGYQAFNIGAMFSVIGTLAAVSYRNQSGQGQLLEVCLSAACNVTTEAASVFWLIEQAEVQRQTGRHAAITPTAPVQVLCRDGRYATTGVLPRTAKKLGR